MVSSNQRSIHEGLHKVIGSPNRGFASIDPERQPRSAVPGSKKPEPVQAVPATGTTVPAGTQKNQQG